jgi:lysozyme
VLDRFGYGTRLIALLVFAGVLCLAVWMSATAWHPSIARYPVQGVDLPENPPPVEWPMLRARGADFAYIVATSGADRRDPAFEANWAALPDAGLRRGALHLYSLCQPGLAQANAFNAVVPQADDALPAAVDVSYRDDCATRPDKAALIADLTRFAKTVEIHLRHPVILRISRAVEGDYELSAALDRPLWTMGNFIAPGYTARPWRLWRASDLRRVDGMKGPVNWNVVAP